MTITGSITRMCVNTNYTMHPSTSKSVAKIHIETARRLLKPDGNYGRQSDEIIDSVQKTVELIANKDSCNGSIPWFVVNIKSVLESTTIEHTITSVGGDSVTVSDPV